MRAMAEPDDNPFAKGAAWIDGVVTPIAQARIPIMDWGFLRGDATYDVAHVWKGAFFRLDDHLARFQRGVERMRYTLPVDLDAVPGILRSLVEATGLTDAYVAMIATRGAPQPGSRDPRLCRNAFYAFAIPFVWIASPEKQREGLHMAVSHIRRIQPASVDPTVKNYHWLDFQTALLEAYDAGAETVVLVDDAGHVCEGPGFNIFTVHGRTLTTPDAGVLLGVTRRTLLELAPACGLQAQTAPVSIEALRTADEVIIASTAGGVMPVTRIDHQPVGAGAPGPVYLDLHRAYWAAHG
jgi:branched-chain amino acid aminotransferase